MDFFNFPKPSQAKPRICSLCKLIFTTKLEFETHMTCHQSKCNQCEYTSADIALLNIHIQIHKKLSCDTYGKQFSTKGNLKTHSKVHSKEVTSCTVCGKILGRPRDLVHHNKIEHQGIQIMCKMGCGKGVNTPRNETRHRSVHKTEKDIECSFKEFGCKFKTKFKSSLECHVLSQHAK